MYESHHSTWQTPDEQALLSVTRRVMNDEFELLFSRSAFPQGVEAAMDALDEVERLDQKLSVFRFDSRVQYINLMAHREAVPLDAELFHLIARCLEVAEQTGGAVDITSGPLWKVWGFARRAGRIPSDLEIEEALHRVGYRDVELDSSAQTIRFVKPGMELNFGCVGKGFALDVALNPLHTKEMRRFLFRGGLSSVFVQGNDWKAGVAHPRRRGKRLAELTLTDEALSTSGSDKQFFLHQGRRFSHIIDPRIGQPADGVLSVTVLAPNAAQAELLSTAFFVLGPDKMVEYGEAHPEIAVLMTIPIRGKAGYAVRHHGFDDSSRHADRLRFVAEDF